MAAAPFFCDVTMVTAATADMEWRQPFAGDSSHDSQIRERSFQPCSLW
jgi:hypothetical protein